MTYQKRRKRATKNGQTKRRRYTFDRLGKRQLMAKASKKGWV